MQNVRLWYKKEGIAKYQAHLDLVRCFSRTLKKSEIPFWYTEGFNPRPYLTFSLPLSLGQEGVHEPVDIRLIDDMDLDEIVERMNKNLPTGIKILEATEPIMDHKEIVWAQYQISLEFENAEQAKIFAEKSQQLVESGELNAQKKTKKGTMKTINLCEMIDSFSVFSDGVNAFINTIISAGPAINLNAELLLNTLESESQCEDYIRNIRRIKLMGDKKQEFC